MAISLFDTELQNVHIVGEYNETIIKKSPFIVIVSVSTLQNNEIFVNYSSYLKHRVEMRVVKMMITCYCIWVFCLYINHLDFILNITLDLQ